jgi:hypothetical protein
MVVLNFPFLVVGLYFLIARLKLGIPDDRVNFFFNGRVKIS